MMQSVLIGEDEIEKYGWQCYPSDVIQYREVINFQRCRTRNNRHCVMCGSKEDGGECVMPKQYKDVCRLCATSFWLHKQRQVVVKFCHGCKQFFSLKDFDDKPLTSKCGSCRRRCRENYHQKKAPLKRVYDGEGNSGPNFYVDTKFEGINNIDNKAELWNLFKHPRISDSADSSANFPSNTEAAKPVNNSNTATGQFSVGKVNTDESVDVEKKILKMREACAVDEMRCRDEITTKLRDIDIDVEIRSAAIMREADAKIWELHQHINFVKHKATIDQQELQLNASRMKVQCEREGQQRLCRLKTTREQEIQEMVDTLNHMKERDVKAAK